MHFDQERVTEKRVFGFWQHLQASNSLKLILFRNIEYRRYLTKEYDIIESEYTRYRYYRISTRYSKFPSYFA